MTPTPKISVLMAVRNGMPFLPEAVESILQQTLPDWELIIADDGSTDPTPQYLQSLTDPRIRSVSLGRVGLVETRNVTVRMAQAPLVAVLDADDVAKPDRLERQYRFLQQQPECVVLGGQVEEIDPASQPRGRREFPLGDEALRWRLFFGSPFIHSSTMMRREAVLACGAYRAQFPQAEDYDLWTRLAEYGRLANVPETLVRYRVHPAAQTSQRLEVQVRLSAEVAAEYARRYVPEISADAVRDLYVFLCLNQDPQHTRPHELAKAFGQIRSAYLAQAANPSEELRQEMAGVAQVFRWRCLERAQAVWYHPWRAWQWVRLAGRFDPEQGTLGRILLRAWKKCLRIP